MTARLGSIRRTLLVVPFVSGAVPDAVQTPGASAAELLRTRVERAAGESRQFYRARGFRTVWIGGPEGERRSLGLRTVLAAAAVDGLDPRDYPLPDALRPTFRAADSVDYELALSRTALRFVRDLADGRIEPARAETVWTRTPHRIGFATALAEAIDSIGPGAALAAYAPGHPEYLTLRRTLGRYRLLDASGGWPPLPAGPELVPGDSGAAVALLRRRLAIEEGAVQEPGDRFDGSLDSAVRRFQRRHALVDDGVVGTATRAALDVSSAARVRQLELNLERWRWLPRNLGERHIMVNIVSSGLVLMDSGTRRLASRVIVGSRTWPTPIVSSEIFALEFSPTWTIPRSILVREVIPLIRRDPDYLRRERIRVFADSIGGAELAPSEVDWSRVASGGIAVVLRQEPGRGNPLGGVKFLLTSRFGVYLHDTPDPARFEALRRTISHGCVRVERARELAECFLDGSAWPGDSILKAMARGAPRRVALPHRIPVHLCYWTAWVDEDGATAFGQDVYGWDRRLDSALTRRQRSSLESH